jgi:hypothetical protein
MSHSVTKKKRKTVTKKVRASFNLGGQQLCSLNGVQIVVLPEYQGPKLKDVPVISQLFDGKKFSARFLWNRLRFFAKATL